MMDISMLEIIECATSLLVVIFGIRVFKKDRMVSLLLISASVLSIGMTLNAHRILHWLSMLRLPHLPSIGFRLWIIAALVPWMLLLTAVFIRRGPGGPRH